VVQRFFILAAGVVILLGAGSAMAQCTTINAVTSASFKITGGQACSTYANLTWTFTKRNGEMTIEWGPTTTYGTKKSLYPSSPVNLPNLTPNTTYYYHVWGFYENRTYEYTKSTFTTAAGAVVVNKPPKITSTAAVACTTGKTLTLTLTATDADNDPISFTVSGQPNWVTYVNGVLTLKPLTGSTNGSARVIASDGKGGADTVNIALTVVASTSARVVVHKAGNGYTVAFGDNRVLIPNSADQAMEVSLFTLSGVKVMQRMVILESENVGISTAGVTSGVYLLRMKNAAFSTLQRVTVRE